METQESEPTSHPRSTNVSVEVSAATHIGRRTTNADVFLLDDASGLYSVGDGMGDTARSRQAALTAIRAVREAFLDPRVLPASAEDAKRRLLLGVVQAHGRLYEPWWAREQRIGTTFAGVVVCGEQLVVGHVGDSRVYLLRASKGVVAQLTQDYTVEGDALRRGMPADAAARLPDAAALTQVIGAKRFVGLRPFVQFWGLGDIALLCTDGVSNRLGVDAIARVLRDARALGSAAQDSIDRSIEAGGRDNATAILVRRTS